MVTLEVDASEQREAIVEEENRTLTNWIETGSDEVAPW